MVGDLSVQESYNLDTDILKVRKSFPVATDENCAWAFWNENISQSYVYLVNGVMTGRGFDIHVKKGRKDAAEDIINKFNRKVNIHGDNIFDYLRDEWVDNNIHGHSVWRIYKTDEMEQGMDIQRVDPLTIERVARDDVKGYRMFIQQAFKQLIHFPSAENFYSMYDPLSGANLPQELVWVRIPWDYHVILRTRYFHQAPTKAALKYMVWKLWILKFMRKYAERFWAPLIFGMIGEPGKYIPRKKEMETITESLQGIFNNMHNFSAVTLPGYVKLDKLESKGTKNDIYVQYLDMLDKQIMLCYLGSMSTRQASGVEKSTQASVLSEQHSSLEGIRTQRAQVLTRFYAEVLLPENGINGLEAEDIDLVWSDMDVEPLEKLSQAVYLLATNKIISKQEARDALRPTMNHLYKENDAGKVLLGGDATPTQTDRTPSSFGKKK